MELTAQCQCRQSTLVLTLTKSLNHYSPRACDCDYCTSRNVAYISDPDGMLSIISGAPFHIDTHGSGQAGFYNCAHCKTMMFVAVHTDTGWLAALNANTLDTQEQLNKVQVVSPKQLSATEKRQRWQTLWMPLLFNAQALDTQV